MPALFLSAEAQYSKTTSYEISDALLDIEGSNDSNISLSLSFGN